MKRVFSPLLVLPFLAACGGSSEYFDVVFSPAEAQEDCLALDVADPTVTVSDNTFTKPVLFEIFRGPETPMLVTDTPLSQSMGHTLPGKGDMIGDTDTYEGTRVTEDVRDPIVNGAHTTTTERVNVVLNRGIDRRTATGTVTVFREVLCRANNNNCPTDWRDHSCTTIIHFQGHRINDPDIERQK